MAEEYVSKDQHRADLLELRGELKEDIAGIRQDVAVLSKNVEHLTQRVDDGFNRMERQQTEIRQDIRELRTTGQRQMWVLVGVVVLGFSSGVIKLVFFPTL